MQKICNSLSLISMVDEKDSEHCAYPVNFRRFVDLVLILFSVFDIFDAKERNVHFVALHLPVIFTFCKRRFFKLRLKEKESNVA